MKKQLGISLALALGLLTSTVAMANDAVLGALLGGGAGVLVGRSMGGRDGAVIGAALGAAAGAAIASQNKDISVGYYSPPPVRYSQPAYYPQQDYYSQAVYYRQPLRVERRTISIVHDRHGRNQWDDRRHNPHRVRGDRR